MALSRAQRERRQNIRAAKREGRIDGRWTCSLCGMRANDVRTAKACCGAEAYPAIWLRRAERRRRTIFEQMRRGIYGRDGRRLPGC